METQSAQIDRLRKELGEHPGDPSASARLLEALVARFREAMAPWPEGLRFDGGLADLIQAQRLLAEVRQARALDASGSHADFLPLMENRIQILIGQLRSDEGKCTF